MKVWSCTICSVSTLRVLCVWPIHLTLICFSILLKLSASWGHLHSSVQRIGGGDLNSPAEILISTSSSRKGLRTCLNIQLPHQRRYPDFVYHINYISTNFQRFLCKVRKLCFLCKMSNEGLINLLFLSLFEYCIVLYCGRVPAANAPGCTAAEGLLYKPWSLVFRTCTARCLHQRPW